MRTGRMTAAVLRLCLFCSVHTADVVLHNSKAGYLAEHRPLQHAEAFDAPVAVLHCSVNFDLCRSLCGNVISVYLLRINLQTNKPYACMLCCSCCSSRLHTCMLCSSRSASHRMWQQTICCERQPTGRFFFIMPPAPTLAAPRCKPLEAMTTHLGSSPTCSALCPAVLVCSSQASVCRDFTSWWNCCCRV